MINNIRTNSFEMEYLSFGKGKENFVIIPGLSIQSVLKSEDAIKKAFSQFTDNFKVYVFDRVKEVPTNYTIEQMAEDTYQAMINAGITSCDIFGASQGGMIAQCIAARHPEFVKKLILGSTTCKVDEKAATIFSNWIALARKNTISELIDNFVKEVYSEETIKNYGEMIKQPLYHSTPEELDKFIKLTSSLLSFDIEKEVGKITSKALVIGSNDDMIFGKESVEQLADKLKCESYLYNGYGHAVYDEAPDYRDRVLKVLEND